MDAVYPIPVTGNFDLRPPFGSPDSPQSSWPSPYCLAAEGLGYSELGPRRGEPDSYHGGLEMDTMTVSEPEILHCAGRTAQSVDLHRQVLAAESTSKTGSGNANRSLAGMQTKFSVGQKVYITPQATSTWESHKSELRRLYIDEDKTLRDIMCIMDARGFGASAKMYKTRFKQWGFVKNNSREDVAKMVQVRRQRAAIGKATTFKRNGKVVRIEQYLRKNGTIFWDSDVFQISKELPRTVRCHTPPPENPAHLRLPEPLLLKELLLQCLKDLSPSFSRLSRPADGRYSANTELWDSPRYLKLACDLFTENRHSQAGSICRSAFYNVHTLAYPPRLDTLFNFLVSQLWWANRDVTHELWRYLGAYLSNVLGIQNEIYYLFKGLATYIESHGYEAYLDFMTECIDDLLAIDETVLIPKVWERHQFIGWCQLIAMDAYFLNGFNPRADRIQARCAQALPRSRFFPRDRKMNEQIWRETFAGNIAPGYLSTKQSRHEKFLKIAFMGYAKLWGRVNGAPVMHPSVTRVESVAISLSKRHLDPSSIMKYNPSYNLKSKILSFLCRDLGQRGITNDCGSFPV